MEPYRPFVDEIVHSIYCDCENAELDKQTKGKILRVLFVDVKIGKVTRPLEVALSVTTASIVRMFKGDSDKLTLPRLI